MVEKSRRRLVLVAAACAAIYVLRKIHFAVVERLEIFGGPIISPAETEAFGTTADIARAQWGNVAAGLVLLILTLLALRPQRGPGRWLVGGSLACVGVALIVFGFVMIGRAVLEGVGVYPFGIFTVVSGLLELVLAGSCLSRRSPSRRDEPAQA